MKNKAVFLDRDGVLNKELGDYVCHADDLVILPDVIPFLQELQSRGYVLLVVTNQSGIIKGRYTTADLYDIHRKMDEIFRGSGIEIAEYYYSPYHQDYCNSLNRKPNSLMVERGLAKYRIDAKRSYMIGDKPRDIEAGEKAGVKSLHIESNAPLMPLLSQID